MINYRKLKQDLSSNALKEGQTLFQGGKVSSVKIDALDTELVRLTCSVSGNFDNPFSCKIEIDRSDSTLVDSECGCSYGTDCQHLAAVLFHLEKNFEDILIEFDGNEKLEELEGEEKSLILDAVRDAKVKKELKLEKKYAEELVKEYALSAKVLSSSPFFLPRVETSEDRAGLVCIIIPPTIKDPLIKMRLALKVPFRSKPLQIPDYRSFIDGVRYREPLHIANKRFCFSMRSFGVEDAQILRMVMDFARKIPENEDPSLFMLEAESLGSILAHAHDLATKTSSSFFGASRQGKGYLELSCFSVEDTSRPLKISNYTAELFFDLDFMKVPSSKLFLKPLVVIGDEAPIGLDFVTLLECQKPGLLHDGIYYRFQTQIKRRHLKHLLELEHIAIPEPLFGTFVENALPELKRVAKIGKLEVIDQFVTLPFTGELKAECDLHYLDGELEVTLTFIYDDLRVKPAQGTIYAEDVISFVSGQGITARSLTEEEELLTSLFQGFVFDESNGNYSVKSDKKVVEFMTEIVPKYSDKISFNCPSNLMGRFVFDETEFTLSLSESDKLGSYTADLKVKGHLKGLTTDHLWDCIATKRPYVELKKSKGDSYKKILVLDLEKIAPIVQMFDELGLTEFENKKDERPLWSLISVDPDGYQDHPVKFKMSANLKKMRSQMLGDISVKASPIPKDIKAKLRDYQQDGVAWLEKLRRMHLAGILADDMGLGKTVQAITALTQMKKEEGAAASIVVCPTSLVYNWKAEIEKFNPKLTSLVVDGTPAQRKKTLNKIEEYDVVITSYTLLQKDIESYEKVNFGYAILDEAQHIKNRGTRNAKSVKRLGAKHRLILTGTPIENSLEELWSLFDYLMPGLLSNFERFNEKYIRSCLYGLESNLEGLRTKVAPFILRRMKSDVLSELPPVSHIQYKCQLSDLQKELYRSYAESARKELSDLVEREGFNKVQIQILATLTRLKQICCHPAIFAKEKAEPGDSAKYEMMLELLESLMESGRKTVIFSQYTRMLNIMRKDFEKRGIKFSYLDGSTKDRLGVVNEFNESPEILVFLVSLKAGGTGLNLTSADTVIHYDPWWNPATEDQATDRVHRMGQKNNVSAYKLVSENTIEEKIQQLQDRKRGLVKKVISSDEEALGKLSWDEVLELLKT